MLKNSARLRSPRLQFYALLTFSLLITVFAGWLHFAQTYRNHAAVSRSLDRMNALMAKLATINELAEKVQGNIIGQALGGRASGEADLLLLDEVSRKLYELLEDKEEREPYLLPTEKAFEAFYLFSKRMIREPKAATLEERVQLTNILIDRTNKLFGALRELRARERRLTSEELEQLRLDSERNAFLSTLTIAVAALVTTLSGMKLLLSYGRTRRLLDALPFPAMILDDGNKVLSLNLAGSEAGIALGTVYVLPAPSPQAGEGVNGTTEFCRDGRVFEVYTEPIGEGRRLLYLNDVTERREAEAVLRNAEKQRALGSLSAGFAHDFNNLLMAIMGNIEYARLKTGDPATQLEALDDAMAAGKSASLIVKKVLAYTEHYYGPGKKLDLGPIAAEALHAAKANADEGVALRLNVADRLPPVFCTPDQPRIIIENLLSNALYAVREKANPTVEVSLSASVSPEGEGFILLEVKDNGEGMSDEIKKQMFEPYFTTRGDYSHGRGLGLAATMGHVKMLKGRIEVTSEVGSGTNITVAIPAA